MKTVSIIVPVYNAEKYLYRCINSLLSQTLDNYEIILVNDASTDNSLEILRKYEQKESDKVRVVDLERNMKQGGAKNVGIKMSQGSYIGFVDSDDWVDKLMFEKLYRGAISQNSDIVDCDYFESDGKYHLKKYISIPESHLKLSGDEQKRKLILGPGRMVCKIFKRELFLDKDMFFSSNLFYEDNELGPLLVAVANKVSKVNAHLYYYYVNDNSTTRSMNNMQYFDRIETSKRMLSRFQKLNIYDKFQPEIEFLFIQLFFINTVFGCIKLFTPPKLDMIKYLYKEIRFQGFDYRVNIYFKNKVPTEKKMLLKLGAISPLLLSHLYLFLKRLR